MRRPRSLAKTCFLAPKPTCSERARGMDAPDLRTRTTTAKKVTTARWWTSNVSVDGITGQPPSYEVCRGLELGDVGWAPVREPHRSVPDSHREPGPAPDQRGQVFEHSGEYASQWAAITSISGQLSVNHETLRNWVRQAEADSGRRQAPTSEQLEEWKRLRRENAELRRLNEILKSASVFSLRSSTVPGRDDPLHRGTQGSFRGRAHLPRPGRHGNGVLSVSGYYACRQRPASRRAVEDERLIGELATRSPAPRVHRRRATPG